MSSATRKFERFTDRLTELWSSPLGEKIAVLVCFSILVVLSAQFSWPDIDLFTRAAVGRLTYELGTAPSQDPFSFLADKPVWHDHEWLAGLLFYGAARIGAGDPALFVLNLLFAGITLIVIARARKLTGTQPLTAVILAFVTLPHMWFIWPTAVRAQVFTYLSYALFLLAFVEARIRNRIWWLAALPPVMVIWVNSHGGFVVGMAAVTIFTGIALVENSSTLRLPSAVAFAGCCVALLVNPYGLSFLEFIFGAVSNPPTLIPEWAPMPVLSYFWLLFAVLCLGAAGAWKRVPREGLALLLMSAHLGFSHRRFVPFLAITTAVYGGPLLEQAYRALMRRLPMQSLPALRRSSIAVLSGAAFIVVGLATKTLLIDTWTFRFDLRRYPVAALETLREHFPPGRVLTHYNDGSYALWRLYPKFKIGLDGRFDGVFTPDILERGRVVYVNNHPDQQKVLQSLAPDYILTGLSIEGDCADREGPRARLFPGYDLIIDAAGFCVLQRRTVAQTAHPPMAGVAVTPRPLWEPLF